MKTEKNTSISNRMDINEPTDISKDVNPHYGYIALNYFLMVAILGIIGLIIALVGLNIDGYLGWILFLVGVPVAFVGLYIGTSYIPLYYFLLRSDITDNLWKHILDTEGFRGDEFVLDVGCGMGGTSIKLIKHLKKGKLVGIDIFSGVSGRSPDPAYRNAKIEGVIDRVEFKYGNVLEISYPDNTFNLVTASSVLHELHNNDDKIKALKEIYRVLKPGGRLITIELLRDVKMFLWLLFFAFVFKPKKFWVDLINKSEFLNLKVSEYSRFLSYSVFIAQK